MRASYRHAAAILDTCHSFYRQDPVVLRPFPFNGLSGATRQRIKVSVGKYIHTDEL